MSATPGSISLRGVSKSFRVYDGGKARLLDALTFGRADRGRDFWALRDVDLEVERGTTMGVLGRNGAGKSTLLRVIAGNLRPTRGEVRVAGQPIFLQMGAGFNPDYTGRENVMLNGLVLGLERKKILERFDEIEAFADIGEFIDQPVRTYSSGMRSRLGFAVAVNVEPDILIVDEALSVGDAVFKQMGLQKMRELRDRGSTILLVSHSIGTVRGFCTRAALMHQGRLIASGDTAEIADRYQALLSGSARGSGVPEGFKYEPEGLGDDEEAEAVERDPLLADESLKKTGLRHGTGEVKVSDVEVLGPDGGPVGVLRPGDEIRVRLHLLAREDVEGVKVGITFRNQTGLEVFSTDTVHEGLAPESLVAGKRVFVDFTVGLALKPGNYGIVAHVSSAGKKKTYYDWLGVAATFKLNKLDSKDVVPGLVRLPSRAEVSPRD